LFSSVNEANDQDNNEENKLKGAVFNLNLRSSASVGLEADSSFVVMNKSGHPSPKKF